VTQGFQGSKGLLDKKLTFENCPSWMCHEARGFTHAYRIIDNLLNKDNSLGTNASEDSSIEVPTPYICYIIQDFNLRLKLLLCMHW
jgi:hypothetical protein